MDPDVASVRSTWDRAAAAWERYDGELAAFTRPVREELVAAIAPRPEDVVLELAGGTGGLSRALAAEVSEVVCTDIAPAMVLAASRRTEEDGPDNVRCMIADAHDLAFDDDSFDAVVCQMGLMLMPDPTTAAGEVRRVLRPDGRAAVATWGPPAENLWGIMAGASLLQHGHEVAMDPMGPGGIFSLSEPARLESLFSEAGFGDVSVSVVPIRGSYERFEDFWTQHVATAGPISAVMDELSDEEVAAVRETCRQACEGMRVDGRYEFTGQALVTSARVRSAPV